MEKLWNNLNKGLKTHLDKNGFDKVILGLSGGLDSAVVGVLASEVLGGKNVKALMMKTRFTSDLSLKIAREIALINNLDYQEIDIDDLVEFETKLLKNAFDEDVKGIVIENLQARIRGQILMSYSNQFGGMVLGCSNKSEAMTGYCTLYGDTCGGLMPIGGIYKSKIFELARWLNKDKIRLPNEVINRAPTAELSEGQRDDKVLPNYKILDDILEKIENSKTDELKEDKEVISKVKRMVEKSAFKRAQMPPILDV